jgi:hypothetical protein
MTFVAVAREPLRTTDQPQSIAASSAFDPALRPASLRGEWVTAEVTQLNASEMRPQLAMKIDMSLARFSSLPGMACYSACNFDPLSRGIGVQI